MVPARSKAYDQRPGFVVLYHDRNHGKGRAIRTGLEAVSGEVVVIQDADLEYDPQDFVPMIEPIREGRTQVVYGSRRLRHTNKQHSGVIYYLGGMLVTYMTRWLYGLDITDEATCYKMLRRTLFVLWLTMRALRVLPGSDGQAGQAQSTDPGDPDLLSPPQERRQEDRMAGRRRGDLDAAEVPIQELAR